MSSINAEVNNLDISGDFLSEYNNYYNFDQFFENFLNNKNITLEIFNSYLKSTNNEDKVNARNLLLEARNVYKNDYSDDYIKEVEKQKLIAEHKKKLQLELQKEKEIIKKEEIIQLVIRQTEYNYEEAKELLEQNNYKYLDIIKSYISGNNNQNIKETTQQNKTSNLSTNQQIYSQIRSFMDYGSRRYELSKKMNNQN